MKTPSERTLDKTLIAVAVIILTIIGIAVQAANSNSIESKLKEMEGLIPGAIRFVEDNEEDLAVILEIQERLTDAHYSIDLSTVTVYPGYSSKPSEETSVTKADFLSEREKEAIKNVCLSAEYNLFHIYITPDVTEMFYGDTSGVRFAELRIASSPSPSRLYSLLNGLHLYEQVNDNWYVLVYSNRRE